MCGPPTEVEAEHQSEIERVAMVIRKRNKKREGTRFRYSAWDGTQVGFEYDAQDLFKELTDDLLYHGDLKAAM